MTSGLYFLETSSGFKRQQQVCMKSKFPTVIMSMMQRIFIYW